MLTVQEVELGIEIVVMTTPVIKSPASCTCFDGPQQVEAAHVRSLAGQSKAQLSVSLTLSSDGIFFIFLNISFQSRLTKREMYFKNTSVNSG